MPKIIKTPIISISACNNPIPGKPVALMGTTNLHLTTFDGDGVGSGTECYISDKTGSFHVIWDHDLQMRGRLKTGQSYIFRGLIGVRRPYSKYKDAPGLSGLELKNPVVEIVDRVDKENKAVYSHILGAETLEEVEQKHRNELEKLRAEIRDNNNAQAKKIFWYVILALIVGYLFYVLIIQGNLFNSTGGCTPNAAGESPGTCT